MRLAVIAQAGGQAGWGHFVRSAAFSASALARGHDVGMIVIAAAGNELPSRDMPMVRVETDEEAAALALELSPVAVVFDTTAFRVTLVEQLRSSCMVASLSPVFNAMARMQAVFSRSCSIVLPDGVRAYCGLEYSIVGPGVRKIDDASFQRSLQSTHFHVAVAFGGTDPDGLTRRFVSALESLPVLHTVWAVIARGSHAEAINMGVAANSKSDIVTVRADRSLWDVLAGCSMGVFGGGVMAAEAIHAGLPCAHFVRSPDQLRMLDEVVERGMVVHAEIADAQSPDRAANLVRDLAERRNELEIVRASCQTVNLSSGAENCVMALENLLTL